VASRLRIALLGAWSGSLIAYALFAIAPAFEVGLPSPIAADLLRRGFDGLDRLGMSAALACALLGSAGARRRGGRLDWLRALLPLAIGVGHAASYFWITPELAALRHAAGGSIGQLPAGDPGLSNFAMLHDLSRRLYIAAALMSLGCCVWDITAGPYRARRQTADV
jgi:hypothetical protein